MPKLFRGHVVECANNLIRLADLGCRILIVVPKGESEIENPCRAISGQHDIGWLDVAMNNSRQVSQRQPLGHLPHDVGGNGNRHRPAASQDFGNRQAMHELRRDVRELVRVVRIKRLE